MKKNVVIGISILILITIFIFYNNKSTTEEEDLQNCSRLDNLSCPEGYICFEHLSGGLGPDGGLPIESIGGDKKCHKECFLNEDCPKEAPACLPKNINTEDYSEAFYLCFSEEERTLIYNDCLGGDQETFSRDKLIVSFYSKYTFEEIEELLKKHGIKTIRRGGAGMNNYIIEPPTEDFLEKVCELKLDPRIIRVD